MSTREVPVTTHQYVAQRNVTNELMVGIRAALGRPLADYYLVALSAGLLGGLGLYMVVSASSVLSMVNTGNPYTYGMSQLYAVLVAVPVAFALSRLNRRWLVIIAWLAITMAIVSLVLVVVPGGPGVTVAGNRAWLDLKVIPRLQPSEFAKAAIILWSAAVFGQPARVRALDDTRSLLVPYLPVAGLILALVTTEKDLGTALIVAAIVIGQLWFAGAPKKVLAWLLGPAAVGAGVLVATSPVRLAKVLGFLGNMFPILHLPTQTISDQSQNAIYALATGGWWGVGPGASRQKWGGLYNGAHTDYILAVLGEELGLFGILVVLALLFTLLWAGLRVARRSESMFWRLTACGITGWFLVQAGVNTLVSFGLLPVLGVPFPLMSFGGSSLLSGAIGIGFLLAAARHEPGAQRVLAERSPGLTGIVVARRRRP